MVKSANFYAKKAVLNLKNRSKVVVELDHEVHVDVSLEGSHFSYFIVYADCCVSKCAFCNKWDSYHSSQIEELQSFARLIKGTELQINVCHYQAYAESPDSVIQEIKALIPTASISLHAGQ